MINIVIPMAGAGSRFNVAGYTDPKPLIPIHGKPMIKVVNQTIDPFEQYFQAQLPKDVKPYFVKNWDSYYLLEGDINCGTNAQRVAFPNQWWSNQPNGAYNID